MLLSAIQQSDSVIHVYILLNIHHYNLSQDIEYSSLCYTVGPYYLSILYVIVWSANPKLPIHLSPTSPPPWQLQVCFIRLWVCFYFLISSFMSYFRFHTEVTSYCVCLSVSYLLHLVWQSLGLSMLPQIALFHSFLWLSNIPLYICTTSSLSTSLLMDT